MISRAFARPQAIGNMVLDALPPPELARVLPRLTKLNLSPGTILERQNEALSRIYFPLTSVASLVTVSSQGSRVEVGLIGKEGMTGFGLAVDDNKSPYELVNRLEGFALVMATDDFTSFCNAVPNLPLLANRFARGLAVQISHTALSQIRSDVRQRLARWLLMIQDRVSNTSMRLTHNDLALMLGVRRPTVTNALHGFESEGLIRAARNRLEITNRQGLLDIADEFYGNAEKETIRLMNLKLNGSNRPSEVDLHHG